VAEVAFDKVEGLSELIRELRQSPERLDKAIRARFRIIAKDVRDQARGAAEMLHPHTRVEARRTPQHWADLVSSITSGADSDTPWVRVGSNKVEWATSFEFGDRRYRQFPWQGNSTDAGYFLWPTIRASREEILTGMVAAVDEAFAPAFPS